MKPEEDRQQFYQHVRDCTGLSDSEIRDFLSQRYEKWDASKKKEYMEGLVLWGKLQQRVKKLAPINVLPNCPICGEPTEFEINWGWKCTKGGMRHRIISTVSKISGLPAEPIIKRLEEFDAHPEIQADCTRTAEECSEVRFQAERTRSTSNPQSNPQ